MNAVTRRRAPSAAAFQHLGALMLVAAANSEGGRMAQAEAAQIRATAIALCQALLMGGPMARGAVPALERVASLVARHPTFAQQLADTVSRALEPLWARLEEFLTTRQPSAASPCVLHWWGALHGLPHRFQSTRRMTPETLVLLGLIAWAEEIVPQLHGPGGLDAACSIAGLIAEVAAGASERDQARMLAAIAEALPPGAWPASDFPGRASTRGGRLGLAASTPEISTCSGRHA